MNESDLCLNTQIAFRESPLGASLTIDRHWDVLFEAGTNFDDANLLVVSASYRF